MLTFLLSFFNFFFYFFENLFKKEFWIYYFVIILGTIVLVFSGFDWWYLLWVNSLVPSYFLFISDASGFLLPIFLLLGLYIYKKKSKQEFIEKVFNNYFFTITFAFFSSVIIKVFAGRESPPHEFGFQKVFVDNSYNFNFGFMREQIFGGFPSGHATVIFALAFTTFFLFPNNHKLHILVFSLALFVGLGVTLGFHWFSEFYAGAILGFVVATIVQKYEKKNFSER